MSALIRKEVRLLLPSFALALLLSFTIWLMPNQTDSTSGWQNFLKAFVSAKADKNDEAETAPETTPEAVQPEAVTTLHDEVQLTIDFLVKSDLENYGQIMPGTIEAARVQNCTLPIDQPEVIIYTSVDELEKDANAGKVISLHNYSNLLNEKRKL